MLYTITEFKSDDRNIEFILLVINSPSNFESPHTSHLQLLNDKDHGGLTKDIKPSNKIKLS